ncbi:reverse gyrase [Sulfodiicoccus acidiphilus]|uniref:Reverse gyrase n=1 Tax=Sulfodiicoccus acidiphilus TaxID=1670455 RepID=A0A348B399_9CREN|nr:reverse gyrase [Sulfodiicoccus acidiphilus]GGT95695.1 reverse gyrase [Sulfodiicoccus acidiphilus]
MYSVLVDNGKLSAYWELYDRLQRFEEARRFFEEKVGYSPWNLQLFWLRRLVAGDSFSMSAPTGLGKTTTLITYASLLSQRGKRTVYIVPTKSLMQQVCDKIKEMSVRLGCGVPRFEGIDVITYQYLNRRAEGGMGVVYDFVAVDDADAIIKSGKTVDKIVPLLGIPEQVYKDTIRLVKLRNALRFYITVDQEKAEKLAKDVEEIERRVVESRSSYSQFVIASATAKPKGIKQKAMKFLLGFEPSTVQIYMRNVLDSYTQLDPTEIVTKMGKGGLILVSRDRGKAGILELKERLESKGIKVGLALNGRRFLKDIVEGKVDVLLGSANYYGVAVRGIDEPRAIRYVVFHGVPKVKLSLKAALFNPFIVSSLASLLDLEARELQTTLSSLNPSEAQMLKVAMWRGEQLTGKLKEAKRALEEMGELVREALKRRRKVIGKYFVVAGESEKYVVFPDVVTYIQGSGRASRMINGKLSFGLSVTVVDDQEVYELMKTRMGNYMDKFEPVKFDDLNLTEISRAIDTSRSGVEGNELKMKSVLIVVESPTKARTISKLFGRPVKRYIGDVPAHETIVVDEKGGEALIATVVATRGHVTDVTLSEIGLHGVEIDEDSYRPHFSFIKRCDNCRRVLSTDDDVCPYCGHRLSSFSRKIVDALRKLSTEVDEVYIATDPDAEGEKIASDVAALIAPYNKKLFRVTYHEVTKQAILEALRKLGSINLLLVQSQLVRRIEDRWTGFELSRLLKLRFNDGNHGAGRVQTPVLGWVVDRTAQYRKNMGWYVSLKLGDYVHRTFFPSRGEAESWLRTFRRVNVKDESCRNERRNPLPPFTTDSLLIESSTALHFNPQYTMKLAQDLFEAGLITYHRTDSVHVSSYGIAIARAYVEKKKLEANFTPREWGKEGTHEAIRPTKPMDAEELGEELSQNPFKFVANLTRNHLRLYDLVFKRFIASQLDSASIVLKTFSITGFGDKFSVEVPVKASGGFSEIYPPKTFNIPLGEVTPQSSIYRGSSVRLMTYAELISEMKSKSIGRPSTYAKTVESLRRHGYVVESKKRSLLVSTKRGQEIFQYLKARAEDVISEARTNEMLRDMEAVESGSKEPEEVISKLLEELIDVIGKAETELSIHSP